MALLGRALDQTEADALADELERLTEKAHPLDLGLDEESDGGGNAARALGSWHELNAGAWDAATFLSASSWRSPHGDFIAATTTRCPESVSDGRVQLACGVPSPDQPLLRRAALLAWPLSYGRIVRTPGPIADDSVARLRELSSRDTAVLGAVFTLRSADLARAMRAAERLVRLVRGGRRAEANLVRMLATKPDPSACSPWLQSWNAVVLTPKLSALVRAESLEHEARSVLGDAALDPIFR